MICWFTISCCCLTLLINFFWLFALPSACTKSGNSIPMHCRQNGNEKMLVLLLMTWDIFKTGLQQKVNFKTHLFKFQTLIINAKMPHTADNKFCPLRCEAFAEWSRDGPWPDPTRAYFWPTVNPRWWIPCCFAYRSFWLLLFRLWWFAYYVGETAMTTTTTMLTISHFIAYLTWPNQTQPTP